MKRRSSIPSYNFLEDEVMKTRAKWWHAHLTRQIGSFGKFTFTIRIPRRRNIPKDLPSNLVGS